jgi:glycosyltransferase involved in cell wall biosynthesis
MLLDVSRLISRIADGRLPTGVDRVVLEYIRRWGPQARAVLQKGKWRRIVSHGHSQELFELLVAQPADFRSKVNWTLARACIPPWPSQDAGGAFSFNLSHTGIEQPGLAQWLDRTRQRGIFFVHDLIPVDYPEFCRAGERESHTRRMETLLSAGSAVICNSQTTLDSLQDFAAIRGKAVPPAVVAPLAPAILAGQASAASPLPEPYFLVIGTIEPRKNHLLLLHLWRQMKAVLGERTPHLVIVGQRGWECENVVDMLERCTALQGYVHELPNCPDAELSRYLRHARALLFPSFAEGFGLPLIEAMAAGTPVIASSLPVFREVAGDVPDYVDSLDGPGWQRAVTDYMAPGSPRRVAQLERLAGFATPTWAQHFAQVESLLERLG